MLDDFMDIDRIVANIGNDTKVMKTFNKIAEEFGVSYDIIGKKFISNHNPNEYIVPYGAKKMSGSAYAGLAVKTYITNNDEICAGPIDMILSFNKFFHSYSEMPD